MRIFVCVLAALITFGCATHYGNKKIVDQATIDQIVVGQTTKADVLELLGKPAQVEYTDSGIEQWHYVYSRADIRATNFIPVVGMAFGGFDSKNNTLTIRFKDAPCVEIHIAGHLFKGVCIGADLERR